MSEAVGKAALDTDVLMRTLGLYPAAQRAFDSMSPEAQAAVTAYRDGINE